MTAVVVDSNPKHLFNTFTQPVNSTSTTVWDMGRDYVVEVLTIQIPEGHVGLTGIQVSYLGVFIVPWNDGTHFLVGNGLVERFPLNMYIGGKLSFTTVNNDKSLAHKFYVRAQVREPSAVEVAAATAIIPADVLNAS